MVIKIKPREGLLESIKGHVMALVTGIREAIWPERLTIQFPRERRWVPERFRGWILLDINKCISCFQCAWACPVNAIQMYRAPNGKWYPGIRYGQCILIHYCIDACPVDALKPTPIHDMAFPSIDSAKFRPEDMAQLPQHVEDANYVIKYDIVGGRLRKLKVA